MAGTPGAESGGIAGLVAFLREHGGAVEADLARYYGISLSDLTCGRLTWRRLAALLLGLPADSSTSHALNGEAAMWGLPEHLLAGIFDVLQVANWQRAARKGAKAPKPTPRPGVTDGSERIGRTKRSPAEVRAYLEQFKPKTEVTDDGD